LRDWGLLPTASAVISEPTPNNPPTRAKLRSTGHSATAQAQNTTIAGMLSPTKADELDEVDDPVGLDVLQDCRAGGRGEGGEEQQGHGNEHEKDVGQGRPSPGSVQTSP